jgi:N-terminal acetyltransferase B complex catalytic subunit
MTPEDLFSLNLTNLDPLTENYDLHFYLSYLMKWPSLCSVVEDDGGQIIGYSTLSFFRYLRLRTGKFPV